MYMCESMWVSVCLYISHGYSYEFNSIDSNIVTM